MPEGRGPVLPIATQGDNPSQTTDERCLVGQVGYEDRLRMCPILRSFVIDFALVQGTEDVPETGPARAAIHRKLTVSAGLKSWQIRLGSLQLPLHKSLTYLQRDIVGRIR